MTGIFLSKQASGPEIISYLSPKTTKISGFFDEKILESSQVILIIFSTYLSFCVRYFLLIALIFLKPLFLITLKVLPNLEL